MDITIVRTYTVSTMFDYVATRFDNAVKYGVWNNGKAPLNGGGGSVKPGHYIGDVMRYNEDVAQPFDSTHNWFASPDKHANAVDSRWFGPFHSRKEASLWLAGYTRNRMILECGEG